MDEAMATGYWCHQCSQIVNPLMEVDIKCPNCNGGFIEEMQGQGEEHSDQNHNTNQELSLWAPILLGMLNDGLRRRRRSRREEEESSQQETDSASTLSRRQQRASAILEVINSLQEREGDERREQMILINPFNHIVSLGDYFVGPNLDQLLQHLAENDAGRHGSSPAKKEAVEAMAKVKVEEKINCSVCLEDVDVGEEAREMPCKHRFHGGCILPWLEMHSSCPVCRYQMPVEESQDSNGGESEGGASNGGEDRGRGEGSGRRFWMPVPWPFSGLFSLSSGSSSQNSESGNGNSSRAHPDEN